jgi:hypothetical protein
MCFPAHLHGIIIVSIKGREPAVDLQSYSNMNMDPIQLLQDELKELDMETVMAAVSKLTVIGPNPTPSLSVCLQ